MTGVAKLRRTCSIEGCSKVHYGRGWCAAHYMRWRVHGDPLGGSTRKGEVSAFLENTVFCFEGDECLIWPYATGGNGYGQIAINGKMRPVNRMICEHEHGPPPTPKYQAAHSCGKGHLGCVNPKHLRWATPKENAADRLIHGTHSRGARHSTAKLTESQVLEIRASTTPTTQLAREIGVSYSVISMIRSRKRWAWLEDAA